MPPISDNNSYPPEGSGDILPLYKCNQCMNLIEPTTEKVVEVRFVSIAGRPPSPDFQGLQRAPACTECYETLFVPALSKPNKLLTLQYPDHPENIIVVSVEKCYSLYNVDSFTEK